MVKTVWEGNYKFTSWVVRGVFKPSGPKIELVNEKEESLLVLKENVKAAFEFAKDQYYFHLSPIDILLGRNMQITNRLVDSDPGNSNKY